MQQAVHSIASKLSLEDCYAHYNSSNELALNALGSEWLDEYKRIFPLPNFNFDMDATVDGDRKTLKAMMQFEMCRDGVALNMTFLDDTITRDQQMRWRTAVVQDLMLKVRAWIAEELEKQRPEAMLVA